MKYRNGMDSVPYAYRTTYPLDIIVIMLGTNDTKFVCMGDSALNARNVAYGAEMIIKEFKAEAMRFGQKVPQFILVAPPLIGYKSTFIRFTKEGSETSRFFSEKFAIAAKNQKATFVDAAPLCETGPDCLHITENSHRRLAQAIAKAVRELAIS
ncbi:MAG: hypothetical protein MJ057_03420 [Sphaerochaetaceae bacterium]|nr:hypothetical protein [Sphaerochaetaceae bacterium]